MRCCHADIDQTFLTVSLVLICCIASVVLHLLYCICCIAKSAGDFDRGTVGSTSKVVFGDAKRIKIPTRDEELPERHHHLTLSVSRIIVFASPGLLHGLGQSDMIG